MVNGLKLRDKEMQTRTQKKHMNQTSLMNEEKETKANVPQ